MTATSQDHGPAGNVYPKFESTNPVVRRLMEGFLGAFDDVWRQACPQRVLEVGCGEGSMLRHITEVHKPGRLIGTDVGAPAVREAHIALPHTPVFVGSAYHLPFPDQQFDCVVCCEVMEHLEKPEAALREIHRLTSRWVILSVPREPLWRVLNMARGSYLHDWGNTPGHVQHFRPQTLRAVVEPFFRIRAFRTPLPWMMLLGEKR